MDYFNVTLCNLLTGEFIDLIVGGEDRDAAIKAALDKRRELARYARLGHYREAYNKLKGRWDVEEVQEGFLPPKDAPLSVQILRAFGIK